jgi:hypothetical protein
MRLLFALILGFLALMLVAFLLLVYPVWGATTHCTTHEEKTLGRLQTVCEDGTRAVSTYNKTLSRWQRTLTPRRGKPVRGGRIPAPIRGKGAVDDC